MANTTFECCFYSIFTIFHSCFLVNLQNLPQLLRFTLHRFHQQLLILFTLAYFHSHTTNQESRPPTKSNLFKYMEWNTEQCVCVCACVSICGWATAFIKSSSFRSRIATTSQPSRLHPTDTLTFFAPVLETMMGTDSRATAFFASGA